MLGIENLANIKIVAKRLLCGAGLFVFVFYIVFFTSVSRVIADEVLDQDSSQLLASGNKLLRARQLLIEGTDALHNNQNQQAKIKLANACAIAPNLPQAHHQLGIALAKLGENEAAIDEFSTAIKLDPNSAASWLNLAAVYQTSGNIDQARSTYQGFVNRFPQDKDINKIRTLIASLDAANSAFDKTTKPNASNDNESTDASAGINKGEIGVQPEGVSANKNAESDYYANILRRGVWLWPNDRLPLKVYIELSKPSNGALAQYVSIMKGAFSDWSTASRGLLSFIYVEAASKADIVCSWSKDISKFKNSSEAANARVYAKNGKLDKGEIEILTLSTSNSKPITDNQVRATCLHEIGHILGLTGHSNDANDVMYISAPLKEAWTKLSNRDSNTIVRLYSTNVRNVRVEDSTL